MQYQKHSLNFTQSYKPNSENYYSTLVCFKRGRRKDKDVFTREYRIIIEHCNLYVKYLLLRYIFSETKYKT